MSDQTTWAPSQYQGMKCGCVHSDAERCISSRTGTCRLHGLDPEDDLRLGDCEKCECCCHERDLDDDDDEFWGTAPPRGKL